jgi:cytochrome c-type biogenesis protein
MTEYFIATGAGLISFLSPCVLPLIPGYISFVSGESLQEIINQKKNNLKPLILFCLGFSTVFILLGATASVIGQIFLQNSDVLRSCGWFYYHNLFSSINWDIKSKFLKF